MIQTPDEPQAPGPAAGNGHPTLPLGDVVGLVDGAVAATTQRFTVVLADDAVVQLDELVATSQPLPDGGTVTHYGIVVEATRHIEGASFATDTTRIARDRTMPGETARRVEVQVLRTVPELWLAPEPGAEVRRAVGAGRDQALFVDQMDQPLAVGLDQAGAPVSVDFSFLNGKKGGHVNISGISGVATKTSYALFLLYQLLETPAGRQLLGQAAPGTRALVFNVKGEDLLQIDRPNRRFAAAEGAREGWRRLGVDQPGAFRHCWPLAGEPGAIVLTDPPPDCSFDFDRVVRTRRDERLAGDGTPVRSFADLVAFLADRIENEDPDWTARVQTGTGLAFLRRLYALVPRLGGLITTGVTPVAVEDAGVSVVDIHSLHETAQRFVVGALLSEFFEAKQGQGREPLRFVVLDELNKYAPREGRSPLKELLVDIAERGRSLGVLLIGAQQAASAVAPAILRNAAVKVVGRLDAGEAGEYRFLTPEVRERATRFLPGTMVLDQPLVPAPIPLRFPFPAFATSVEEGRPSDAEQTEAAAAIFGRL